MSNKLLIASIRGGILLQLSHSEKFYRKRPKFFPIPAYLPQTSNPHIDPQAQTAGTTDLPLAVAAAFIQSISLTLSKRFLRLNAHVIPVISMQSLLQARKVGRILLCMIHQTARAFSAI
jgi:hypothetical protein